jgi:hypothetical protein
MATLVQSRTGKGRKNCHRTLILVSSRNNHALAIFQSRITVSGETFKTFAVSSTLNPPKYRRSTTRPLRGSTVASEASA